MSSIRDALRAGISAAVLAGLAGGCSRSHPQTEALNDRPLIIDDAMQQREWQQSNAVYQNGSVKSYATRFPYVPSANRPQWTAPIVETPIFLGESLLLPVSAITTPPGTSRTYNGVQFGPTSTGMPPLPPSVSEQGATPGYPNAKAGATPNAPTPTPAPVEPAPEPNGGNSPSNSTPSNNTPSNNAPSPAAPAPGAAPTPGSSNAPAPGNSPGSSGATPAPSNPPANSGTPAPQ